MCHSRTSHAPLRSAMHQVAHVAFNKLNAKHRDDLIQYRKAMAAFILKTEVCFPLFVILVSTLDDAFFPECCFFGSC
jgi:hypothetical protein